MIDKNDSNKTSGIDDNRPGLLNDIMFKIVFGGDNSQIVLRHLINALLNYEGEQEIVELDLLKPELDKAGLDDKGPILDIRARDRRGVRYNIEVQLQGYPETYIKRTIYYLSRMHSGQLTSGSGYHQLEKSISITLADFKLFPDLKELHNTFRIYHEVKKRLLADQIEFHYIELVKFKKDKPRLLQTRFERWLYALKFSNIYYNKDLPAELKKDEGILMAIDAMRQAFLNEGASYYFEAQEKAKKDLVSNLYDARLEGIEEGRAEMLTRVEAERRRAEQEAERAAQEAELAKQEAKRAEQEVKRAEQAERELAELKAQLERLKRRD